MSGETSMVERVARAICQSFITSDHQGDDIARVVETLWDEWIDEARAAIAAMREPTEAMTDCSVITPDGFQPYPNTCETVWIAMIDAALSVGAA